MKNSKTTSFRDELLKLLTIYTLVPLLFVAVVFILFLLLYFNSAVIKTNKANSVKIENVLENTITDYSAMLDKIDIDISKTKKADLDSYTNQISKDIVKFFHSENIVGEFYILDKDYNVYMSTQKNPPSFLPPYSGTNWGLAQKLNSNLNTIQYAFVYNSANQHQSRDLVIGKTVTDDNGNVLYYLIFDIPCDNIITLMDDHRTSFVLTNKYGDIYLSNTNTFTKWYRSAKNELIDGNSFFAFEGEWFYKYNSLALDDSLIIYTTTSIKSYIILCIAYGGLFLFATIIFYFAISRVSNKITKQRLVLIDEMVDAFTSVQKGDLNVRMDIQTNDEFGIISNSYNLMLESLNDQIERNIKFARETAISEIKQLESQFNPHFLFNTLTNINYMINLEPQSASKMIIALSKILRYSIDNTIHNVTLEKDLTYVNNYISIEQIRFKSRLNCTLDIDEETLNCVIPKLIFQPIIENSIIYGFEGKECLDIHIKTFIKDNVLYINLRDDGLGISVDKLEEINKILSSSENTSKHIGLFNIDRRIKLIYGENYGLSIRSQENIGTEINITIPVRKDLNNA